MELDAHQTNPTKRKEKPLIVDADQTMRMVECQLLSLYCMLMRIHFMELQHSRYPQKQSSTEKKVFLTPSRSPHNLHVTKVVCRLTSPETSTIPLLVRTLLRNKRMSKETVSMPLYVK